MLPWEPLGLRSGLGTVTGIPAACLSQTLRLCLEPVKADDFEASALPSYGRVPNAVAMTALLKEWRDDCDSHPSNVAVLYAAGHGAAITPTAAHIFLPDVNTSGDRFGSSLNLAVVQEAMAHCSAGVNVYLVDACASREKRLHVPNGKGAGLDVDLDDEELRQRSLFIASARYDTEAWTTDTGDNTVFSEALLRLIERSGAWLTEPEPGLFTITADRLEEDFPSEFARLLGTNRATRQLPTFRGAQEAMGLHRPEPVPQFDVCFSISKDMSRTRVSVMRFGASEAVMDVQIGPGESFTAALPAGSYYYTYREGIDGASSVGPLQLIVGRDRDLQLVKSLVFTA